MPPSSSNKSIQWRWSCALSLALILGNAQAQISYGYDALGRLITVTDATGTTANYQYDAVGNILSITQYAAGSLAVFNYQPAIGSVGSTITFQGTGFSGTASQNIVKFNGVQATVESATTTKLTVKVPTGATTGAVTVQVGTQMITAGQFTILPQLVATVSTLVAKPGEIITLTPSSGSFIDGDPSVQVRFNGGNPVTPLTVTPNAITVKAPYNFSDGPITVESSTSLYQTSTSLYYLPESATATSSAIKVVGQAAVDGSSYRATTSTSEGGAMVRIPISTGDVTLSIISQTGNTTGTVDVELIDPQGQKIKTRTIDLGNSQGIRFESNEFAISGTYTIVLTGTLTPAFDVTTSGVSDLNVNATLNSPVSFGPNKIGQYIQIPVIEPGPMQLALSNVKLSGSATLNTVSNGSQELVAGNSQITDFLPIGSAGKLIIIPSGAATVSGTLTVKGTLVNNSALGSSPTLFSATFPEQWLTRKVNTTSGQAIGIAVSDVNQPGGTDYGNITATTPSGSYTAIYNGTFYQTLIIPDPGTGTTSVTVQPMSGATSNSLNLHVSPSIALAMDGTTSTMTGNTNAHTFAHFNVGATDKVQVVVTGLNVGTGQGKIYLQRPDDYYTYMNVNSGADLIFRADGGVASGLHALTIDPPSGGSVSAKLRLMTANPTVGDDQLTSFNTTVANDTVIHNFTGAAASPRYLLVQGLTYSGGTGNGKLTVFMPNGYSTSMSLPSGYNWMFPNLNQDGPYSIMVSPPSGGKVSGKIIESTGTVLTKGVQSTQSITAGQGKVMTFNAASGTTPKLTFASLSPVPITSAPVNIVVFRPDGNKVASATYTSSTYAAITLPAVTSTTAGTYVIGVFPANGQAMTFKVTQN